MLISQVVQAFETFSPGKASGEQLEEAAVLGWTLEILQVRISFYSFSLVFMINFKTNFGKDIHAENEFM